MLFIGHVWRGNLGTWISRIQGKKSINNCFRFLILILEKYIYGRPCIINHTILALAGEFWVFSIQSIHILCVTLGSEKYSLLGIWAWQGQESPTSFSWMLLSLSSIYWCRHKFCFCALNLIFFFFWINWYQIWTSILADSLLLINIYYNIIYLISLNL
jgi:hypothetical protein